MKQKKILFNHIVTYPTPYNISYFYSFGFLAGFMLMNQIITGLILAMFYINSGEMAFDSIENIMRNVNYGWFLRYLHSNGASFFFIILYLHISKGIYYKSYMYPRDKVWYSGLLIYFLVMGTAFLGYVLPWGQMSFWGATVITNLISVIPFIGDSIVEWVWCGYSVNSKTLQRFFILHYLLPFIILALVMIHIVLLHEVGSSNPLNFDKKNEKINFFPYFYIKDIFATLVLMIFLIFIVCFYSNIFNHADNFIKANPMSTPHHIVPEWYFLPFYAILRAIADKTLGILLFLASLIIYFFIPLLHSDQFFFYKDYFKTDYRIWAKMKSNFIVWMDQKGNFIRLRIEYLDFLIQVGYDLTGDNLKTKIITITILYIFLSDYWWNLRINRFIYFWIGYIKNEIFLKFFSKFFDNYIIYYEKYRMRKTKYKVLEIPEAQLVRNTRKGRTEVLNLYFDLILLIRSTFLEIYILKSNIILNFFYINYENISKTFWRKYNFNNRFIFRHYNTRFAIKTIFDECKTFTLKGKIFVIFAAYFCYHLMEVLMHLMFFIMQGFAGFFYIIKITFGFYFLSLCFFLDRFFLFIFKNLYFNEEHDQLLAIGFFFNILFNKLLISIYMFLIEVPFFLYEYYLIFNDKIQKNYFFLSCIICMKCLFSFINYKKNLYNIWFYNNNLYYRQLFWILVIIFISLGYVGQMEVDKVSIELGQDLTLLYFLVIFFLGFPYLSSVIFISLLWLFMMYLNIFKIGFFNNLDIINVNKSSNLIILSENKNLMLTKENLDLYRLIENLKKGK